MEIFPHHLDIFIVWIHQAEGGDIGAGVFKLLDVHQMQILVSVRVVIIITNFRPNCSCKCRLIADQTTTANTVRQDDNTHVRGLNTNRGQDTNISVHQMFTQHKNEIKWTKKLAGSFLHILK